MCKKERRGNIEKDCLEVFRVRFFLSYCNNFLFLFKGRDVIGEWRVEISVVKSSS